MGDERIGALAHSILYIEYKKPSVMKIFIPETGEVVQTAGVPLDLKVEVPLLKGAINPIDGMTYMVGFQIWDSFASRLEGLCRLRIVKQTDQLPVNAELFKEGLLLSFSEELDPQVARSGELQCEFLGVSTNGQLRIGPIQGRRYPWGG